jgi:MoaA/NifB/PqqE/SkfB family radical SAM enzyme
MHDKSVCQAGTYDKAVKAIRLAKAKGFRVNINCTLFNDADPAEVARFFDDMKAEGLDGITVSPGYAYGSAPDQKHFLNRMRTKELFRGILAGGEENDAVRGPTDDKLRANSYRVRLPARNAELLSMALSVWRVDDRPRSSSERSILSGRTDVCRQS